VVKFIAERGLAFRVDENVGSPRMFFQKIFKTFFKQILKKRCDASSDLVLQQFHKMLIIFKQHIASKSFVTV